MQNFDTELDTLGVTRVVKVSEVSETVRQMRPNDSRTHLLTKAECWTWMELRDYVTTEIEARFGTQTQMGFYQAMGAFKGFIERWGGEQSAAISRYVFEVCDGMWLGKPVAPSRWCKNNDPFFAIPIAERLAS
jgi:hypothetical protein